MVPPYTLLLRNCMPSVHLEPLNFSANNDSSVAILYTLRRNVSQIYKKVKPLMDALEAAQEAKAAAIADLAKVKSSSAFAVTKIHTAVAVQALAPVLAAKPKAVTIYLKTAYQMNTFGPRTKTEGPSSFSKGVQLESASNRFRVSYPPNQCHKQTGGRRLGCYQRALGKAGEVFHRGYGGKVESRGAG